MNLPTALTEASRVAVAERNKHSIDPESDNQDEAELYIQSRVNAAVFAWWAANYWKMDPSIISSHDPGEAFSSACLTIANGEAS